MACRRCGTIVFAPKPDGAITGSNVRDVEPAAFITAFAEHLKKSGSFKVPEWAEYVKTARKCTMGAGWPAWGHL